MSRKTQRYSKEFKAEAVRTVLENQLSISEGASRLSLPEGTLGQWVTAARKGLGTPGSRTVAELESEILQLRKALNEARLLPEIEWHQKELIMSRKTQRYSKEFKAEAVRTVLENQLSISEGASRLSLPEGTLGQWVTAARKGLGTPGSRTVAELESEILQLRKALNEARLERDILKKAAVDSICQCNTPFNYLFHCPRRYRLSV